MHAVKAPTVDNIRMRSRMLFIILIYSVHMRKITVKNAICQVSNEVLSSIVQSSLGLVAQLKEFWSCQTIEPIIIVYIAYHSTLILYNEHSCLFVYSEV